MKHLQPMQQAGFETPPRRKTPLTEAKVFGVTASLRRKSFDEFDTTKKNQIEKDNERLQQYRHSADFLANIKEAIYRPTKPQKPQLKEYLQGTMKDPLTLKLIEYIRREKLDNAQKVMNQIRQDNPQTTSEIGVEVNNALESFKN